MSYYQAQTNKPRSLGLLFVITLHILLIYFLFTYQNSINSKTEVEAIKAEVVEIVPPKIEEVVPQKPSDVKQTIPDFTLPPNLDFVAEPAAPSNTITQVQREVVTADVNPGFVKAKRSAKGLTHPKYPKEAARAGEQGTTELNLNIAESGKVTEARVSTSSGSDQLDQTIAAHAVRHWKFTPCMEEGKPVSCWHKYSFQWNIENANVSGVWRSVVDAKSE